MNPSRSRQQIVPTSAFSSNRTRKPIAYRNESDKQLAWMPTAPDKPTQQQATPHAILISLRERGGTRMHCPARLGPTHLDTRLCGGGPCGAKAEPGRCRHDSVVDGGQPNYPGSYPATRRRYGAKLLLFIRTRDSVRQARCDNFWPLATTARWRHQFADGLGSSSSYSRSMQPTSIVTIVNCVGCIGPKRVAD